MRPLLFGWLLRVIGRSLLAFSGLKEEEEEERRDRERNSHEADLDRLSGESESPNSGRGFSEDGREEIVRVGERERKQERKLTG